LNKRKKPGNENLALIAVKNGVRLEDLFQAMIIAKEKEKSVCKDLNIEYRGSVKDESIFLITKNKKVVSQLRVSEQLLCRNDIRFEEWLNNEKIRRVITKQNREAHSNTIQTLRHGMRNINLQAEVIEIQEPQKVYSQFGTSSKVTNAWIADETGKVRLCLWNEKADTISEGDNIELKNASVADFKGERQLRLGKNGTIKILRTAKKEK
jgi:hypothetical protein